MCDEEFLFLRSPSSPKGSRRRVRAMFVCPSCGWHVAAVASRIMQGELQFVDHPRG